ncbi:DUF3142 domain-containing protein [Azospirillum canadense]|uniref:DUF3142 domain-containing protein n=1 Tax=Azospirillum canadense TaxID=403962 RepID=UPI002225E805|nr:DUF3142 domain-containing protein [Azospirillum canadense]MCW2238030.1 hypothetical protein [Azospirillum canadense]
MGLARWLCLVLMLSGLTRSGGPAGPLPQDAYVWQRRWTPALGEALRQSSDMIGRWRVLAAERGGAGGITRTAPDWVALAHSGRPVVLVVRIDGSAPPPIDPAFLAEVGRAVETAAGQGVDVAGIEIDHDCATARLDGYALFLEALRRHLPPGLPLSITALPTWLPSPLFGAVVGRVDEIVLQVHAVRNPRFGLFDPRLARDWLDRLARRTNKPFRVALPAYGVRVRWGADGRLAGVEGEMPTLAGEGPADELAADPAEVAALLRGLERDPPPGLRGVVWFRLPTAEDGRAWSLATWRAVVRGAPLRTALSVEARDAGTPGLRDLVLVNAGAIDAELPRTVLLEAGCAPADGVGGYALRQEGARPALARVQGGMLRGGQARVIGWMRCGANKGAIDVQP